MESKQIIALFVILLGLAALVYGAIGLNNKKVKSKTGSIGLTVAGIVLVLGGGVYFYGQKSPALYYF